MLSTKVMVAVAVVIIPQSSVAVQVIVDTFEDSQSVGIPIVAKLLVTETPPHVSDVT